MGWVSCREDAEDRFCESAPIWPYYGRPSNRPKKPLEPKEDCDGLGDSEERIRLVIQTFWSFYGQARPAATLPSGQWEQHFANVQTLHSILRVIEHLDVTKSESCDSV